jgi:hypothetical protein
MMSVRSRSSMVNRLAKATLAEIFCVHVEYYRKSEIKSAEKT